MICPKCGFDQPDDAYCAFCGVSIKKYRQDKRKKQYVVYGVVCFVLIAGIFIVVNAHRQAETPGLVTRYAEKKGEDQIRDVALPETGQGQFEVGQESQTGKTTPPSQPSAAEEEVVSSTERLEDEGPGAAEASQELPSAEPTVGSVPEETGGEQLTARDWFEKGRALDDESEAEVEFYKKALEVDPEFAPAYYRLGAIHFRRAMYELADQEFVKFLAHASESQRQTYSIYVYYSPSDMERLSEAVATEKASGEGEEQEASAEAPAAEEEVSAGAEAVEKAPEEAEEGQTETAGEAARATSEGTEEAETEIPAENTSEAEEEVEY